MHRETTRIASLRLRRLRLREDAPPRTTAGLRALGSGGRRARAVISPPLLRSPLARGSLILILLLAAAGGTSPRRVRVVEAFVVVGPRRRYGTFPSKKHRRGLADADARVIDGDDAHSRIVRDRLRIRRPPRRESSHRLAQPRTEEDDDDDDDDDAGFDDGAFSRAPTSTMTMLETVERVSDESGTLPYTDEILFALSVPQIEIALSLLVLLSSAVVAVGTLPDLPPAFSVVRNGVEEAVTILFLVEFFLRFYAAGQFSPLYLQKPLVVVDLFVVVLPVLLLRFAVPISAGIISQLKGGGSADWELVSFLPSWLMSGSALINLRLLRILRLQRVLTDLDTFTKFEVALGQDPSDVKPYQLQLARVVLNIFTSLSVTSGLIYTAEKGVNPMITDYFSALYFTLITLTTVGFGDIAPVTGAGRVIVCLSILGGVAIIPAQLANLVEALLDFQDEKNLARRREESAAAAGASGRVVVPWDDGSREGEGEGGGGGRATMALNSRGRPVFEAEEESRRFCMICGAGFHRGEAIFCWKCGAKTLKDVPAEVLNTGKR